MSASAWEALRRVLRPTGAGHGMAALDGAAITLTTATHAPVTSHSAGAAHEPCGVTGVTGAPAPAADEGREGGEARQISAWQRMKVDT
mmetsp:Transcript_21822/g.37260  ORF Transcript_21822/g.37260 Transcript_21822/m.37260 type:complete len:88 (+) Transcript_21822:1342-1605(+)